MALVGESGSGKSTLALCMACLERPTSGRIWLDHREIAGLGDKQLREFRPQIQLVFQDPTSSLNPRLTAAEIVAEPLSIQGRHSQAERDATALEMMRQVGLPAEMAQRRPVEFSGGQRQRLAIARAIALKPKLLILDEALSAMDCSVQAQIANLLQNLQVSLGLTYLFITHDLAMAAHLADEIAVMDRGQIVEMVQPETLLQTAKHEATNKLIAAAMPRFARPALELQS
jgi:peptide/nickel transport system ATP-binding protein